jgi:HAD superfamily hydrolase (TIGR01549 family)
VTEAAIFDLDGTLVNLPIDYEALYERFRKIIGIHNIEPITETVAELNASLKQKIFDIWTETELATLSKMAVVNEGIRLYQQNRNMPKALVTMQSKKTVEKILSALNLSFQAAITREDSLDRTTQIRMAMQKLGLKPENVIVYGDRETDRAAAEKVGCKFKMVK